MTQPAPAPEPGPAPSPEPAPSPADPADVALAKILHPWVTEHHVGDNRRVAAVAKAWLIDKGL